MSTRIFVPRDAAAVAVGADEVAPRDRAGRGVEQPHRSRSSAPAAAACCGWSRWSRSRSTACATASLGVEADVDASSQHRARGYPADRIRRPSGPVEKIGFFATQTRLTFARCGVIDPQSLDAYRATGGYEGLEQALSLAPAGIVRRSGEPRACAAAAAPASPPASSGRRSSPPRPTRSTSSATPTKATAAPSPIAC